MVELCGTASWYEDDCVELTPSKDQEILLTLARETVSVAVSVSDAETNDPVDSPTIMVDDYTYANGETSHTFPARDGLRKVVVTATGYDTTETNILADDSYNMAITLTSLPACSDGAATTVTARSTKRMMVVSTTTATTILTMMLRNLRDGNGIWRRINYKDICFRRKR